MSNYETLKVNLEKNGEVMIRFDTGERLELHKHNVKFDDDVKEIIVDVASKTYWIDAQKIAYYWIHKEDIEKK